MANTVTNPTWIKSKPHASAEKQVGDSDPSSRTDVINRPAKGVWAVLQRMLNGLYDGATVDGTDTSTTTALGADKLIVAVAGSRVLGLTGNRNAGETDSFDLAADEVVLVNTTTRNTVIRRATGTLTVDSGDAGPAVNSRDTAGAHGAGFVHIYFIWNGSTLGLTSSTTAPTTGPAMPTGYTHWAYATTVYWDGSAYSQVHVRGSAVYYTGTAGATLLSSGNSTTEASLSLGVANGVPTTAQRAILRAAAFGGVSNAANALDYFDIRGITGGAALATMTVRCTTTANSLNADSALLALPQISQTLYYILTRGSSGGTASTMDVYVAGYTVKNGDS